MDRRSRYFIKNVLFVLDGIIVGFTFVLSYYLRNKVNIKGLSNLLPFYFYLPYLVIALVIWFFLLRIFKNYSFLQGKTSAHACLIIFKNLIPVEFIGLSSLALLLYFTRDRNISRTFLVLFAVLNYFSLVFIKIFVFAHLKNRKNAKNYFRRALIIGHKSLVSDFLKVQDSYPELLIDVIVQDNFIIPDNVSLKEKELENYKSEILNYVWNNVVDEVMFIYNDVEIDKLTPLIKECSIVGVMFSIVFYTSGIEFKKIEIDTIGKYNFISFTNHSYIPSQRFIKRLLDVIAGLIGTLIFTVLYIFLAPLIKLTSKGPVIFVQKRKGKNGREFNLYKFRTMYADAEKRKKELLSKNEMKGSIFKMKDDPRITPLGRFLRKSSLDEFPQFINILQGHMSLVGTRPPTVDEYESYLPHHRRRLSINPGLTGLWQISGRNEISDFEEIVKLDTEYIDNWSLWLDFKIVIKTILVLFKGR